jgi:DNA ligase-1
VDVQFRFLFVMSIADDADYSASLGNLQAICNVCEQRGRELLEASNGSLERAVDVFFHQQVKEGDADVTDQQNLERLSSPTNRIRNNGSQKRPTPHKSPSASSENSAKQARLSSFFKKNEPLTPPKKLPIASSQIITIDDSPVNARDFSTIAELPKAATMPVLKAKTSPGRTIAKPSTHPGEVEVSFERLSKALQEMSDTTKRTIKLEVLQKFIEDFVHHSQEAEKAFGLTCALNIVLGKSADEPLGVSGRTVSSALQDILGVGSRQLSMGYRETGDFGDAAASFFQEKKFFVLMKSSSLSIVQVYNLLQKIVVADGGNAKKGIVNKLLRSCQNKSELRFMVRLLIGCMRIGSNVKTVLAAVAMAFHSTRKEDTLTIKSAIALVQKTHDLCPNLELILQALLKGGFDQMKTDCGIQLLTPICPMLAHPTHSLEQVEKVMVDMNNSVVLEWKYDGVRCQAHFDGTTTKLFSRHMLETTTQYPDAVRGVLNARKKSLDVNSFILDSEIVGVEVDGEQTRLLPFQDLSRRKKKDDGKGVQVKVFVFDIMFLNGKSCVDLPLWERQRILREHFEETEDFAFVSSRTLASYDTRAIQEFFEESVRHGTEGLMVKMLGKQISDTTTNQEEAEMGRSTYESGTRSHSWLKVKKDYVKGYADTIDVVPIGAW